jgi:hypothetical protein
METDIKKEKPQPEGNVKKSPVEVEKEPADETQPKLLPPQPVLLSPAEISKLMLQHESIHPLSINVECNACDVQNLSLKDIWRKKKERNCFTEEEHR